MENTKNKNDLVLKIAPYVSLISLIVYIITILIENYSKVFITNILFALPVTIANFLIVKEYNAHNKNTMKSLLGFILSGLLMLAANYAFLYFDSSKWYFIVKTVIFVLIAIFTINQFLLTNTHYSCPTVLFANQIIMILTAVISVAASIMDAVIEGDNALVFISLLIFSISTMLILLIMEMRVNDAKVKRSSKGYVFVKSNTNDSMLPEEDMFISNKLFYSLPWIAAIGLILLVISNAVFDQLITWGYSTRYLIHFILTVSLFILVNSYKAHNKDIMKVMLGFLLGLLLFENMFEISCLETDTISSLKSIATIAMGAINIIFLIEHLELTKTHESNTSIVNIMKASYVIYATLTAVTALDCSIFYILGHFDGLYYFVIKPVVWIICIFPVITAILTIDTRVNGFKIRRENNKNYG